MDFLDWIGGDDWRVNSRSPHPSLRHCFFTAYPGNEMPPFWIEPLKSVLGNLLTFAAPKSVYNIYGRIFNLVYLLMLPAIFVLHYLVNDN